MKAAIYREFKGPITVEALEDPAPAKDGVVVAVKANGVCRSDWHGWMGHDIDITSPHVPGHELAGVITAVGSEVRGWQVGDRVTSPFICGCGTCRERASGNPQVCPRQEQPGFFRCVRDSGVKPDAAARIERGMGGVTGDATISLR